MSADDELISLHEAATLIPGADAGTLKRHARAGRLTVYRPSKALATTRADVKRLIAACRVIPRGQGSGLGKPAAMMQASSPTPPLGLSSTELASMELDSVLGHLREKKTKR